MSEPIDGWLVPELTPQEMYVRLVRQDVTTLLGVATTLEERTRLRHRAVRDELRRTLAGVIAHCETVRLALDK